MDAYYRELPPDYRPGGIVAAIRALVEQKLPEESWPVDMRGPVYDDVVAEAKQRRKLRAELLTIAAELEGGNTH
jgi:hypothetical protein